MTQELVTNQPERRALKRRRTLMAAKAVHDNGFQVVDCVIRDVTQEGARLKVANSLALPDAFELRVSNTKVAVSSRVVWRKLDQVGVAFAKTVPEFAAP